MFSRREREYLRLLVDHGEGTSALESLFPNPVYRRKLAWGIRRKVASSLADWELYAAAVRRAPHLWVRNAPLPGGEIPLVRDPFVSVLRAIRSALAPVRKVPPGNQRRGGDEERT